MDLDVDAIGSNGRPSRSSCKDLSCRALIWHKLSCPHLFKLLIAFHQGFRYANVWV